LRCSIVSDSHAASNFKAIAIANHPVPMDLASKLPRDFWLNFPMIMNSASGGQTNAENVELYLEIPRMTLKPLQIMYGFNKYFRDILT
jgi:hypothetical protein